MTKKSMLFQFTPAEAQAIKILQDAGYAFPSNTRMGVARKMLYETWERQFPGREFPKEEAEINAPTAV